MYVRLLPSQHPAPLDPLFSVITTCMCKTPVRVEQVMLMHLSSPCRLRTPLWYRPPLPRPPRPSIWASSRLPSPPLTCPTHLRRQRRSRTSREAYRAQRSPQRVRQQPMLARNNQRLHPLLAVSVAPTAMRNAAVKTNAFMPLSQVVKGLYVDVQTVSNIRFSPCRHRQQRVQRRQDAAVVAAEGGGGTCSRRRRPHLPPPRVCPCRLRPRARSSARAVQPAVQPAQTSWPRCKTREPGRRPRAACPVRAQGLEAMARSPRSGLRARTRATMRGRRRALRRGRKPRACLHRCRP